MMKSQKLIGIILTCALSGLAIGWLCHTAAQADDAKKQTVPKKLTATSLFMRVKLGQAQGMLEGLTVEDFDQIEKEAAAMFLLTKAEKWGGSKDPKFVQLSDEFGRLSLKVAKYAKEKNLDGAALSYMQLTLTCIECHRSVRDMTIKYDPLWQE